MGAIESNRRFYEEHVACLIHTRFGSMGAGSLWGLQGKDRIVLGTMTIHDFYSNILQIDCDTDNCRMSEDQWYSLDHSCLKTAVNGAVFRDDLGRFTAFRELLLGYYPDKVWKRRIAEQLHEYSATYIFDKPKTCLSHIGGR